MHKFLCLLFISVAIALLGCESQGQNKAKTAPHQVVKPQKKLNIKDEVKLPVEAAKAVAEQAEKRVPVVVDKNEETTTLPPAANETKKQAGDVKTAFQDEIILEASYGTITFPHRQHAAKLDCSTCHDATQKISDITKEVTHKLCRGCHREGDTEPTSCKDCHKK